MKTETLRKKRAELIDLYGPWTAANIRLADGLYTIGSQVPVTHGRLKRFKSIILDITGQPFPALRVLDLACLEGEYAIEFARRGAKVLGIEGRSGNIEKARFVKEALGLQTLELAQDDVRNLSSEKYGFFDVVLCSGILYHLDAPDIAEFAARIAEVCQRCAIVDTHVSHIASESFTHDGITYWGRRFIEHRTDSTEEERESVPTASLDNLQSFWPTRPSLYNLLARAGFSSVYECRFPAHPGTPDDRLTLVAIKGTREDDPDYCLEEQRGSWRYHATRFIRNVALRSPRPVANLIRRLKK